MRTSRNKEEDDDDDEEEEEEEEKKRKNRDALLKCYASHRIKKFAFLDIQSFTDLNFSVEFATSIFE
jgi:hypothetical protein